MNAQNWQSKWKNKVKTEDDLVRFVDDVGFCTISMLERFPYFPSQEQAMGMADVLGQTWFWKDDLHIQKRIYYTRLFSGKPGFISFEFLPIFIATHGEVADELMMYGKLPITSQEIYRVIEERGPIATKKLKEFLGADAQKASAGALIDLERKFIITKTDITGRERGTYGYVWDLAERWTPEAFEQADKIGSKAAFGMIMNKLKEIGITADKKFLKQVMGFEGHGGDG